MSELLLKETSLSAGTRIRIETSSGEWAGLYEGREVADGWKFYYFLCEAESYRVTLVARDDVLLADVNSTSGDHKTLALMEEVESLVVDASLV